MQIEFMIDYTDVDPKLVKSHIKGPKTKPLISAQGVKNGQLKCEFVPTELGAFEVCYFSTTNLSISFQN
jgi:hypothetical protein